MKTIFNKHPLIFMFSLSVVLFILSFFYVIFINKGPMDRENFYKSSGQYGLTTLIKTETLISLEEQELLTNKTINEDFTARYDNLGIIAIPFNTYYKSINDKIAFRLKEIGSKDWYYQNTYNANQFQNKFPFPFGFPVIADSKNKSYTIQIESLEGKRGDSLSIGKDDGSIVSIYKYSKSELLNSPGSLAQFLLAKIDTQFQLIKVNQAILMLVLVLLPFVLYLIMQSFLLKIILNNKALLFLVSLLICMSLVLYRNYIFNGKLFLFEDFGSDSVRVSLPTYIFLFDWFKNGMPLWSDKLGIGTSILSHGDIIFDPFTYILFLFGRSSIIYMFVYMVIIKIILSGVFFWKFLGKYSRYKFSSYSKIIGALTYAFGGYMIVSGQNYVFSTIYVFLPLIMLGFEVWLQDKKKLLLVLMLALTALYFYYFFYMTVIFFVLYSVFRYYIFYKFKIKHFLKYLLSLAIYILVAMGISAFYWLPSILLTLGNLRIASSGESFDTLFKFMPDSILTIFARFLGYDTLGNPMNYTGYGADYFQLATYAGIITVLLVPQIFLNLSKQEKRPYFFLGIMVAIFLLVPFFSYVFNGFSIITYRWTFILQFCLALFLSIGLNKVYTLNKINFKLLLATAFFFIIISVLSINYLNFIILKEPNIFEQIKLYQHSPLLWKYSFINLRVFLKDYIFIATYIMLTFLFFKTQYKKLMMAGILVLVCIELAWFPMLFINNRFTTSPDPVKNHLGYFDYTNNAVNNIKSFDSSFYRIDKSYDSVKSEYGLIASDNEALVQDYRGLNSYNSNNQPNYVRFIQAAGIFVRYPNPNFPPPKGAKPEDFKDANLNYINGVGDRYLLQSFLGVKYYLVKEDFKGKLPNYYQYVKTVNDISIYRNNFNLPLGMTFDSFITSKEFSKLGNSLKDLALLSFVVVDNPNEVKNLINQNTINDLSKITSEKDVSNLIESRRKDAWRIISYKQDNITGEINVDQNKILVLTIPHDKGWTAYVNGHKAKVLKVDNGMIGIKLLPGEHVIELKYFPPGMSTGVIVTIVTILLLIINIIFRKKILKMVFQINKLVMLYYKRYLDKPFKKMVKILDNFTNEI